MTTLAIKDGQFAADTQLTGGGVFRAQKIFRLPDGGIAGGCGDWGKVYAAIQWLLAGETGEAPRFKGGTVMVLRPDGSIWLADDQFPAYPLLDKFAAVGCGGQAAMVAMAGGASAGDAVKAVCAYDSDTSGPVQMLSLEEKRKPKRLK